MISLGTDPMLSVTELDSKIKTTTDEWEDEAENFTTNSIQKMDATTATVTYALMNR